MSKDGESEQQKTRDLLSNDDSKDDWRQGEQKIGHPEMH